jgi:hypothetical protein
VPWAAARVAPAPSRRRGVSSGPSRGGAVRRLEKVAGAVRGAADPGDPSRWKGQLAVSAARCDSGVGLPSHGRRKVVAPAAALQALRLES